MSEIDYVGNIGEIPTNKEPYVLTDVVDDTLIYIGTSQKGNQPKLNCWKIKKVWRSGNIWQMGFPNKDQSFSFIWNERGGYDYK